MFLLLKKNWKSSIWTIIILIFCSLPSSNLPRTSIINIPHFDKILHFGIFFFLALLFCFENKNIVYIFIFSFALGLFIEIEQHYLISSRSGDIIDLIADTIGATVGIIVCFIKKKFN